MVNDTAVTPAMDTSLAAMGYAELQRERDRLRHDLRKAKQAEEKAYEIAEGRVAQYIDMLIASVTKAEEQGKAIARLLQEAKDRAEKGEAKEKAKVQELTRELKAMTERAYRAEEALREKTRTSELEATRNLAHSCKARVKENALSRQLKGSEERLKKAETNLDQARVDLDAANERTAKFAELTKNSFTLASGVLANSFAMGERMTTCCNHLGNFMDAVSSSNENFACAVDSSRQGMRLVTNPKAPGLRVQMLMGTSDETEAQMTKDKCTELTPFMHETQLTVARKKVYLQGEKILKRKLEVEGYKATTTDIAEWRRMFKEMVWEPTTQLLTKEEFIQSFSEFAAENQQDALSCMMGNLQLEVEQESKTVRLYLDRVHMVHRYCKRIIEDWQRSYDLRRSEHNALTDKLENLSDCRTIVSSPDNQHRSRKTTTAPTV